MCKVTFLATFLALFLLTTASPGSTQLFTAIQKATTLGRACSVAIGATSGHSARFFARMDGAPTASVGLALARGYTAKDFGLPTEDLIRTSSPFGRLFDVQVLGEYASGPGGLPLPGDSSIGVACEFNSEKAILAPSIIAQSVLNVNTEVDILTSIPEVLSTGSLITLKQAKFISDFILSNLGSKQAAVVIVDAGAILKYIATTDSVSNGYVKAAISKARAARLFDLPESSILNNVSEPGQPAYGVQITNGGLFPIAGGSLILNKKNSDATQAIGALAIEGDLSEDEAKDLVQRALEAFYGSSDSGLLNQITLRQRRGITALEAQEAIRAAIQARLQFGSLASPGVYAVRDLSGYLRAFYYEDGVEKGAPDIALKSSLASSLFQVPSEVVGNYSRPNLPLYNIELLFGGLVSFQSAYPLTSSDGLVVGSIGVSGTGQGKGTSNDGIIARKAAMAVRALFDPCAQGTGRCPRVITPIVTINVSASSPYKDEIISLSQVAGLIDAVQRYDLSNSQFACASVFDAGVRLKGQLCSDDAFLGATDLTQRKSISGQAFGKPNQDLQGGQLPSGIVYKIEVTNGGLFFNGGGAPLKISEHTVGSVGVAGAANDIDAVDSAVEVWKNSHQI